ncbi:hypothetical protein V5F77_11905 [Xanthobacter sp. DSM 24535]|uniref:hypothetical protein n=1 Tax=Roseixanthobacter psychrophilus TaxID=3119917 RepID=UPI00372B3007
MSTSTGLTFGAGPQDGALPAEEGLTYSFRPRLIGSGSRFRLDGELLHWSVGARSGVLNMRDVTRVRLSFHPGQLASPNFETVIHGKAGEKLTIGSLSRTSITNVDDHRKAYAAFVAALHEALSPHTAHIVFDGGLPVWRWWLMSALALVTGLGLLAVLASALGHADWTVGALILVLCPLLAWPLIEMLWRNRPAPYSPSALPPRLLPS